MDTAIILAGGRASRLGRPKALEAVGGKAMAARVVDAVHPLAGEILVSVADARMARALRVVLPPVRFVTDRRAEAGPMEGIVRGFPVARGERILLAPCDAPFLRTELYRLLLDSLGSHDAAVPRLEVPDPVRAVYRREAVLRVLKETERPPESPSALVDRLDAAFVDEERVRSVDPQLTSFLDVNTPEDLVEAKRGAGPPRS